MTALARAAIRRLRTGVLPHWELNRLSVGYASIHQQVQASLVELRRSGTCPPLFVLGEWGTGKTHLLSYIRQMANENGLASMIVSVNARNAPLNQPQRFYSPLVRSLIAGDRQGLRTLLASRLMDPRSREVLAKFAATDGVGDLARPLSMLCDAFSRDDQLSDSAEVAWFSVLGGDLAWSNYSYKREVAIARLSVIPRLVKGIDVSGVVFVFDEAETIDQLWNILSRLAAYEVLGRLCAMRGAWCVFGVTERFRNTIERDMKDYAPRISATPVAARFVERWQKGALQIVSPPLVQNTHAFELAGRVAQLYEEAFGSTPDRRFLDDCVREWAANPFRNPRRLIRGVVQRLDSARPLRRTLTPKT